MMTEKKDIRGLMRALRSPDPDIHSEATKALGTLGPEAIDKLCRAIRTKNKEFKLGIIGALAEFRDPRSVGCLVDAIKDNESEIRWEAAVALGEIGDSHAVEPLVYALRDPVKCVRHGAAFSLAKIGWKPPNPTESAYYFIGMQEWQVVKNIGKPAIPALTLILKDKDNKIRTKAIDLLGEIRDSQATPALIQSMGDENREVRWHAVLASPKCGIPLMYLPRGLSKRPQMIKNPTIAGFLNFLLPGLGYGYLGKWWGPMIFQIDVTATVWLFKYGGEGTSYPLLFAIYLVLAIHAYYLTVKMPRDPP